MLYYFLFLEVRYGRRPQSLAAMDLTLRDFIDYLWEEGEPRQYAADCLSGFSTYIPSTFRALHGSWRLYNAWGKRELPARSFPLSRRQLHAFLAHLMFDLKDWRSAAVMFLAYHCFLRTMEFMNLVFSDLSLDASLGKGIVRLRLTKCGARLGVEEGLVIEDAKVVQLCLIVFRKLAPMDRLLDMGEPQFRSLFACICRVFKLDVADYKPYSLRRGGATEHFQVQGGLARTCVRGRWNDQRTARIYITEALAASNTLQESDEQRTLFNKYADKFERCFG